jgi:hypothetical protein
MVTAFVMVQLPKKCPKESGLKNVFVHHGAGAIASKMPSNADAGAKVIGRPSGGCLRCVTATMTFVKNNSDSATSTW